MCQASVSSKSCIAREVAIWPNQRRCTQMRTTKTVRSRSAAIFSLTWGLFVTLLAPPPASSQSLPIGKSSSPIMGGNGLADRPSNPFLASGNHKTPDGRLCISIHPTSRLQANKKIFDQDVLVENICGQSIRVQVCYAGSTDCIVVPLSGYQRLQRTLGVSAVSGNFRYEWRELL